VMKYLLELIPNEEQKNHMILSEKDCAFRHAASNGHIEVMNFLL